MAGQREDSGSTGHSTEPGAMTPGGWAACGCQTPSGGAEELAPPGASIPSLSRCGPGRAGEAGRAGPAGLSAHVLCRPSAGARAVPGHGVTLVLWARAPEELPSASPSPRGSRPARPAVPGRTVASPRFPDDSGRHLPFHRQAQAPPHLFHPRPRRAGLRRFPCRRRPEAHGLRHVQSAISLSCVWCRV